ncbi:hypothetical protein GCM10027071_19040 [Microbacterium marinum]
MPGWVGILVPLVLSVVVCTVLAGRRLSAWRLTLAVMASQFLFHNLFILGTVSASPMPMRADRHMHGSVVMPDMGMTAPASVVPQDVWMPMMHAIAVLVTVAALYRGERMFNRLREIAMILVAWVRVLLPALVVLPVEGCSQLVPAAAVPVRRKRSPLVWSAARRGPPLIAAF